MKKILISSALLLALGSPAWAHGNNDHAAKPRVAPELAEETAFGKAGDPQRIGRTIRLDMNDTMRFTPAHLTVKRGETIRLVAANKGQVLHELVIGTAAELKNHAEMMKKFPDMEHDEAYMTHVKPGTSGEIVWQFTKAGTFSFACLIPGHFEAGMVGSVTVK